MLRTLTKQARKRIEMRLPQHSKEMVATDPLGTNSDSLITAIFASVVFGVLAHDCASMVTSIVAPATLQRFLSSQWLLLRGLWAR
jgi:hypothetical protein